MRSRETEHGLPTNSTPAMAHLVRDTRNGWEGVDCPGGDQPVRAKDSGGPPRFAASKGLAAVAPSAFSPNARPPAIQIEAVTYRRKASRREPILPGSDRDPSPGLASTRERDRIEDTGLEELHRIDPPFESPLRLPAGSHEIDIHYTAARLTSAETIRFQVKCDAVNPGWLEVGSRRVASFHDLKPGAYDFRVRATNSDDAGNEAGAALSFVVQPFLWQTRWFRFVLTALVGTSAFYWYLQNRRALEARSQERADFARQLMISQEKERARVARELHDDVTQRLARFAIDAGRIAQNTSGTKNLKIIQDLQSGLTRLSEDVHALSYQLHSSVLEDLGLAEGLQAECERWSREHVIPIILRVSGLPAVTPPETSLSLFRIAQESLRNIAHHAQAHDVEVSLRALDGGLQLAVQDNGIGFDPDQPRHPPSLGLTGMRERAELLGGQLDIETSSGHGTTILAWIPLKSPPT